LNSIQLNGTCGSNSISARSLADFDDEHAVVGQMIRRGNEDAQREVESVVAGGQAQLRFVAVFGRQCGEFLLGHIRRVADDEVVAPPARL
jgi:hypothetical protein